MGANDFIVERFEFFSYMHGADDQGSGVWMSKFPPLNALKSFVVAGQKLSFSKAALELNVTPGAVSRLVRKLEEHVGTVLFRRTSGGLELTAEGADLLREVEGPLSAVADATRRLRDRGANRRLTISCYPTFAARWLMPRWVRFFDRHPDIEVQIATTLTDIDLHAERTVDLAIQLGPNAAPTRSTKGIASDHLLDIDICPVARPGLFREFETPAERVRALSGQTLVHATALPGAWRNWLRNYAETCNDKHVLNEAGRIDTDQGLTFETQNLAFQAALEGIGVAIGIRCLVDQEIRDGLLVEPFGFRHRSSKSFRVVYQRHSLEDRSAMLYRDWLLEEAGAMPSPH